MIVRTSPSQRLANGDCATPSDPHNGDPRQAVVIRPFEETSCVHGPSHTVRQGAASSRHSRRAVPAGGKLARRCVLAPAVGVPLLGASAMCTALVWPCLAGAALGTLALVGSDNLWLAVRCAALAGAGCPPLEGAQRSLWPTGFQTPQKPPHGDCLPTETSTVVARHD
jgi:hypothetical protein